MNDNPEALFRSWLELGRASGLREPQAMTLATASADGRPSARVVLLKRFDDRGLVFVTNYASRKAIELQQNPRAALLFYWDPLQRQVRVEGPVAKAPPSLSDAIHRRRPRQAQLGAWASPQSQVLVDRESLERRLAELDARFPGEVPRPDGWGAYRLEPEVYEFWQSRPHRLHDRLRYRRQPDRSWLRDRLAP